MLIIISFKYNVTDLILVRKNRGIERLRLLCESQAKTLGLPTISLIPFFVQLSSRVLHIVFSFLVSLIGMSF